MILRANVRLATMAKGPTMSDDLDLLTVKVQRILAEYLSDVRLSDKGGFMVPYESTMVVVSPRQMDENRTAVVLLR